MIVDDAADAFLERRATEIDKQSDGLAGQAKIGQQLFAMCRVQPFDRFDLHQQAVIDEQIDTKGRVEARPFEIYIDRHLPIDPISERNQFSGKHGLVYAFQ